MKEQISIVAKIKRTIIGLITANSTIAVPRREVKRDSEIRLLDFTTDFNFKNIPNSTIKSDLSQSTATMLLREALTEPRFFLIKGVKNLRES